MNDKSAKEVCDKYFAEVVEEPQLKTNQEQGATIMESKKKLYAVDVHWDVNKCYKVEATSREDAERQINEMINRGDVCIWTDGYEAGECDEVRCSGEADESGEIQYY